MNKIIINKIKTIAAMFAVLSYGPNDTSTFQYCTDGKIYLHVTPTWQEGIITCELGIGYSNEGLTQPVINLFNQNFDQNTAYPITDLEQVTDSSILLHEFRICFRLDKTDINYTYKAPGETVPIH